ncbi:hypothetical protein OIU85_012561 [Salix viminalis]|uniref:Uncharacterized protein n=1 Tax=Salix viminalis TaxID=40686 RepID=A0A9Q0NPI6_SALVM|nr:hypothetical protein OIU85_012561 [Salix viminalis]
MVKFISSSKGIKVTDTRACKTIVHAIYEANGMADSSAKQKVSRLEVYQKDIKVINDRSLPVRSGAPSSSQPLPTLVEEIDSRECRWRGGCRGRLLYGEQDERRGGAGLVFLGG